MSNTVVSKEQIIDAANSVARQYGWNLEECRVIYDEENALWKRLVTIPVPEVEGHDYQAVIYGPKEIIPTGNLWVVVDRNTGEVLRVIEITK